MSPTNSSAILTVNIQPTVIMRLTSKKIRSFRFLFLIYFHFTTQDSKFQVKLAENSTHKFNLSNCIKPTNKHKIGQL